MVSIVALLVDLLPGQSPELVELVLFADLAAVSPLPRRGVLLADLAHSTGHTDSVGSTPLLSARFLAALPGPLRDRLKRMRLIQTGCFSIDKLVDVLVRQIWRIELAQNIDRRRLELQFGPLLLACLRLAH